jgi:hypothetical protein
MIQDTKSSESIYIENKTNNKDKHKTNMKHKYKFSGGSKNEKTINYCIYIY